MNQETPPRTAPVSVLILTHNEEINLEDCLDSVAGWTADIWIIDSGSKDRTLEIARRYTDNIYHLPFKDFGTSRNWGLDHFDFKGEWVLVLDADERVTPELRDEILDIAQNGGKGFDGYYINRLYIFYGKPIRHSGWYPSWNMRLWRHRMGRYEKRANHNHVILRGKEAYCRQDLVHEDRRDFLFMAGKQNKYAQDEAKEYARYLRGDVVGGIEPSLTGSAVQRKRWLKQKVFVRLPFRPLMKFLYLYIWKRGFLDGRAGFRFCVMWAVFEYLTSFHLWEQSRFKEGAAPGSINAPKYYRPVYTDARPPRSELPPGASGLRDPAKAAAEGGEPWPK